MTPSKLFLLLGAVYGFLGVALGAFGAHALKQTLTPERLAVWHTAVDYQLWHALALLAVALLLRSTGSVPLLTYSGSAFAIGILVFSGSLYALCLTDVRVLGAITPIGGVALLAGWGLLAAWALLTDR